MRYFSVILVLIPFLSIGQNDFENRYFTMAATLTAEIPAPELSAFEKKVASTFYKKGSEFSEFGNQTITAQNFWQPIDMAATVQEQGSYSRVSIERLQDGFGRTQVYGYTSDGQTRARNEVYRDQRYYSPIFNPYGSYYRNRNFSPYSYPRQRRNAILTFGNDN